MNKHKEPKSWIVKLFPSVNQFNSKIFSNNTKKIILNAVALFIVVTFTFYVESVGDEYKNKDFTGRDKYLDKCYFNKRPHTFSSSELRERVAEKEAIKSS